MSSRPGAPVIQPPPCAETDARTLSLAEVLPADASRSRAEQTRSVLERMEAALRGAAMDFSHVVRTWFHLDDILGWYGEFNDARNAFFEERGVFEGVVPASTGVGRHPPGGAALVGGLLAVAPASDRVRVLAVPSPLQCSAIDYRSAFSRAVEVEVGGRMNVPPRRHLYVSGTAAIDPQGRSVARDDPDGQIGLTMAVVEAILRSRGMAWGDVTRAIAYFADPRDAPRLAAWCRRTGVGGLDATPVHATICREELAFELEVDAVSDAPPPRPSCAAGSPQQPRAGGGS